MRTRSGFTLLELSIVLIIVALITSMGVVASMGAIESARRASTENKLNAIEKALMDYRTTNDRLPCPASASTASTTSTFGVEADKPGNCTGGTIVAQVWTDNVEGTVPVKTLGLPNEFAFDGWGRRISYTVATMYTGNKAFLSNHLRQQCGGTVVGVGGATDFLSSSNAIYTLVSFGPNGHGGYLANGVRMSSGSTNADEQLNCRCNAAAVSSGSLTRTVQKNPELDVTSTAAFDDIVRFKERWQMQTIEETKRWATYDQTQIYLGLLYAGVSGAAKGYTRSSCNNFSLASSNVGTSTASNEIVSMAMMPGNAYAYVYSSGTGCELWSIDGTTYASSTTASPCPALDGSHNTKAAISDNYYLFMTDLTGLTDIFGNTIYLKMWKYANGAFNNILIGFTPNTMPPPVTTRAALFAPSLLAVSPDAEYVILGSSTQIYIYRRTQNNLFTQLTTQPFTDAQSYDVKFAAGGNYIFQLGRSNDPLVYRKTGENTYTSVTGTAIDVTGFVAAAPLTAGTMSTDGGYIAIGTSTAPTANNINTIVHIYRMDYDGGSGNTVFTKLTIIGNLSAYSPAAGIGSFAFSKDNKYLYAMELGGTNRCGVHVFEQTGPYEYSYHECALDQIPASSTLKTIAVPR